MKYFISICLLFLFSSCKLKQNQECEFACKCNLLNKLNTNSINDILKVYNKCVHQCWINYKKEIKDTISFNKQVDIFSIIYRQKESLLCPHVIKTSIGLRYKIYPYKIRDSSYIILLQHSFKNDTVWNDASGFIYLHKKDICFIGQRYFNHNLTSIEQINKIDFLNPDLSVKSSIIMMDSKIYSYSFYEYHKNETIEYNNMLNNHLAIDTNVEFSFLDSIMIFEKYVSYNVLLEKKHLDYPLWIWETHVVIDSLGKETYLYPY